MPQHQRLSRRKYAPLMKFLRDVIVDKNMSSRTRMTAAIRLDDILARQELRAEKAAQRDYKLKLAIIAARRPNAARPTPDTEEADRREEEEINALFDRVLNKARQHGDLDEDEDLEPLTDADAHAE